MSKLVGQPPECATKGCTNWVSTSNKHGYNIRCDECLNKVRNMPRVDPYLLSVYCPTCFSPVNMMCTDVKDREMGYIHKTRRAEIERQWNELFPKEN
jgi:phage FluMu protein Com